MARKSFNLTPKNLVGAERDRFFGRLIMYGTLAIVLLALGLVGYSIFNERYLVPRKTVAQVEGTLITGEQFQARVRINRARLVNSFMQYYQMQGILADPALQQQINNQLLGINYQLQPLIAGENALNELIDDELLKLEAPAYGITVSEEQVDRELESFFGYYLSGTPTLTPTFTPFATSTLSATQLAIVSATPTLTPLPEVTSTPSPTATSASDPAQTPVPTATPFTREAYEQALADYFASQASDVGVSQQAIRDLVRASLYRQAFRRQFEQSVPRVEEQVWARHILVPDAEEARLVLGSLNAGRDWADIAAEVSLDDSNKDRGGDLGWFSIDTMVEPFAQAAFALEIGEISDPVETDFGFHIIQVLGHEERPLTQAVYDQRVQQALSAFLAELREKYNWSIEGEVWKSITPNEPRLPLQ